MILGGTIKEIQGRMTMTELGVWIAYRKKYGPMNDVRRYDRPAAMISWVAHKITGGKMQMKDFMPFGRDEEKEATLEDIINVFGGVKVGKPR